MQCLVKAGQEIFHILVLGIEESPVFHVSDTPSRFGCVDSKNIQFVLQVVWPLPSPLRKRLFAKEQRQQRNKAQKQRKQELRKEKLESMHLG